MYVYAYICAYVYIHKYVCVVRKYRRAVRKVSGHEIYEK